jgi:hypothetical protein
MKDKFEYYGEWFLPSEPDNKIKGILLYDPLEDYSILKLLGSFQNTKAYLQTDIILGITDDEDNITLFNCYLATQKGISVKSPIYAKSSQQSATSFKILYILHGYHFHSLEQMKFNKIKCELLFLDDWLQVSGFEDVEAPNDKEIHIRYKLPDDICFELEHYKAKISFAAKDPAWWPTQKTAEITQKVYFSLESKSSLAWEQLFDEVIKFQNFLVLSLYTHTYPTSIELFTESYHYEKEVYTGQFPNLKKVDLKIPRPIKLFSRIRKPVAEAKSKIDWQMLFSYQDIKEDFPEIIGNWYRNYNQLKPSLDLVFEQFYSREKILETSFLTLAQAAETLHARLNPDKTQLLPSKFKELKQVVKDALPEEHKELANALNNNLYLSLRLEDIFEKYSTPFLLEVVKDQAKFLKDIKHSRNYYTHYSPKEESKALKGLELVLLKDKLLLLLFSAFLIEIGFDKEKLQEIFKAKSHLMLSHLYK